MMDEDLEISLKKICSEDRMEFFVKSKMIQVNLKGNIICHSEAFSIDDTCKCKKEASYTSQSDLGLKVDFAISRFNYEYIKSPKYICVDKQKLETVFNKVFENKVPNSEDEGIGDHPLIKNLEANLNFLKYERLLSYNSKIMKNKDILKKLKENKIRVNLPVMFNQISPDNSDYISIINELINAIESLKKTVDVTTKPSLTNITINNNMSSPDLESIVNDVNAKSKKGTSSSFKLNKSIPEEDFMLEDDVKSKIQNFEDHLTQFIDDKEKNRKLLEQNLVDRFSKEVLQIKMKIEETQKEMLAPTKINNSEKFLSELYDLFNQLNDVSQGVTQNYIDRRLVTSHITKILYKNTSSKLKLELLESLSSLLQLDNQERKQLGLSPLANNSTFQSSFTFSPFKDFQDKLKIILGTLKASHPNVIIK